MDDEQRNKSHKARTTGNKAARKDEIRKKKAGIDLQPNRGKNVKAFGGVTAGSRKAHQKLRSLEKREVALRVPTLDKTLRHIVAEPPLLVVVAGPPKVGKTTLIRSMVKFYSGRNIRNLHGPVTVMAGRSRRVTFMECPNTLTAMCDLAKVADLVLLMVDGSYGFEMETFEFLNIAQVHGFPKMFGVVSHLDNLRTGKALKKRKKFLRHRFWHEVAQGAKLLCLSPMLQGLYRSNDVLKLHRLLISVEPKVQNWRNTHSCVMIDRHEDITPPDEVASNPNCSRTIAFYGYVRGKPMKANQLLHLVGMGDYAATHISRQDDPCIFGDGDNSKKGGNAGPQGQKMRHLTMKQKRLYAPYCDVGGITYDDDAIYVQEDPEMLGIERSGEGLNLLRELQRSKPIDAQNTNLDVVVRRPVDFANEDTMELRMDPVKMPHDSDSDSDSSSDSESSDDENGNGMSGWGRKSSGGNQKNNLSDFGVAGAENDDSDAGSEGEDGDADGALAFAPRAPDAADSVRINVVQYPWGEASADKLKALKNLFVTGDWNAGEENESGNEGGEDEDEMGSKGYNSEDDDFEAQIRGDAPINGKHGSDDEDDNDDNDDGNDDDDDDDAADTDGGLSSSFSSGAPRGGGVDALASVGGGGGESWGAFTPGSGVSRFRQAGGGGAPVSRKGAAGKQESDDDYDILQDDKDAAGADDLQDSELNGLVAHFLAPSGAQQRVKGSGSGAQNGSSAALESLKGADGVSFFDPNERFNRQRRPGMDEDALEEHDESEAVSSGAALTEEQERLMKKRMERKKMYDDDYDIGDPDGAKNNTMSYYHQLNREVEEKKQRLDSALDEMGDDVDKKIQLVGYFSGLYVRFVVENVPVEFVNMFDPRVPLIAGGVNAGEDQYSVVHAKIKRHRWYPKILKAQDPLLVSMGWRRFQTQPIFATEDPNGRARYLKYTPMHMHCFAAFYAPVTPTNTGFLAIPVNELRYPGFRIPCTGYTIANDNTTSVVKKLKLTGTPQKIQKTTVFIKGMFNSDVEAAKFVGAKVKSVSGIRGIIKAVLKGKNGLVRATFEDKIFMSDIVFIRAWKPVDPPRFCVMQRNLVDPEWRGMRPMRELRIAFDVPLQTSADSEYREIKRRHRAGDESHDAEERTGRILLSRSTRMQLPFDMKEEFIPLSQTNARQTRLAASLTVAPEPRELQRKALIDTFAEKANDMSTQKKEAKKRARVKQQQQSAEEEREYVRKLKAAKKETARKVEFRSQHKSRK